MLQHRQLVQLALQLLSRNVPVFVYVELVEEHPHFGSQLLPLHPLQTIQSGVFVEDFGGGSGFRGESADPPVESLLCAFRGLLDELFEMLALDDVVAIVVEIRCEDVVLFLIEIDSFLLKQAFQLLPQLFSLQ